MFTVSIFDELYFNLQKRGQYNLAIDCFHERISLLEEKEVETLEKAVDELLTVSLSKCIWPPTKVKKISTIRESLQSDLIELNEQ